MKAQSWELFMGDIADYLNDSPKPLHNLQV